MKQTFVHLGIIGCFGAAISLAAMMGLQRPEPIADRREPALDRPLSPSGPSPEITAIRLPDEDSPDYLSAQEVDLCMSRKYHFSAYEAPVPTVTGQRALSPSGFRARWYVYENTGLPMYSWSTPVDGIGVLQAAAAERIERLVFEDWLAHHPAVEQSADPYAGKSVAKLIGQ